MKRTKVPLLILITVILLAIGAMLPAIAAALQDGITGAHSGYSHLQAVKPVPSENRHSLSMLEKLALLSRGETVDIDESQATMTTDEVYAAAETHMEAYINAGIFQWFDWTYRSAQPKLGIDLNNTSQYTVYWTVTFLNKKDPSRSLLLDIDDETGKILSIKNAVYRTYCLTGVWERNREVAETFSDLYFTQLGIRDKAASIKASGDKYQYAELDGEVSCAKYLFEDPVCGEIIVELYIEGPGGFYIHLPT